MKKIIACCIVAMVLTAYQFNPSNTLHAEEGKVLKIDEVIKNIDPDTTSKAQFKAYFEDVKGKLAKGEGKVVNILPGKEGHARVAILTPASNPEKGYNVVLYTGQDAPSELQKNDRVMFEGEIDRVNAFKGASIDIHGTYKKTGGK